MCFEVEKLIELPDFAVSLYQQIVDNSFAIDRRNATQHFIQLQTTVTDQISTPKHLACNKIKFFQIYCVTRTSIWFSVLLLLM